jgi:hypothetical protein
MPQAATVVMDGRRVDLNTPVQDGAVIKFNPAQDGKMASAKIKDYVTDSDKVFIKINGREFTVDPIAKISGQLASLEDEIPDDAFVTIEPRDMILSDIFNLISFKPESMTGKLTMKINGQDASFTSAVNNNDEIDIYWENMHK